MNRLIVGIKVLSAFKHEKLYESAHIAHINKKAKSQVYHLLPWKNLNF